MTPSKTRYAESAEMQFAAFKKQILVIEPYETIDAIRKLDRFGKLEVERLRGLSRKFPKCAELWDFIGDVMQICDENGFKIADSIDCYKQAIAVNPNYAVAHESLGYALDTHFDDFVSAEKHFRYALEHGCRDSSKLGLARVLAQQGKHTDAVEILEACDDPQNADWISLRDEIEHGTWYDEPTD